MATGIAKIFSKIFKNEKPIVDPSFLKDAMAYIEETLDGENAATFDVANAIREGYSDTVSLDIRKQRKAEIVQKYYEKNGGKKVFRDYPVDAVISALNECFKEKELVDRKMVEKLVNSQQNYTVDDRMIVVMMATFKMPYLKRVLLVLYNNHLHRLSESPKIPMDASELGELVAETWGNITPEELPHWKEVVKAIIQYPDLYIYESSYIMSLSK